MEHKQSRFWRGILLLSGAVFGALSGCAPSDTWREDYAEVGVDVSPDGKHLLFIGLGRKHGDIFLLDLVSGKVKQLTDTDTDEKDAKFSADGKHIVFARWKPGFQSSGYINEMRIWTMELATKKETQITFPSTQARPAQSGQTHTDDGPAFSADGKFVVFQRSVPRNGSPNIYVSDLYLAHLASGSLKRLTFDAQNATIRPVFWQNDKAVAYTMTRNSHWAEGAYLLSLPVGAANTTPTPAPTLLTPKGANYYAARPMEKNRLLLISDPGKKYVWKLTIREANGTFTYLDSSINGLDSPTYDPTNHRLYYLEGMNGLCCYDLRTKTKKKIADQAFFNAPLKQKVTALP